MHDGDALSRRRFLWRGAVLGGALVWAVPGVELMSSTRAFAAAGSGTPTPVTSTIPTGTGPTEVLGESFQHDPAASQAPSSSGGPDLPVSVLGESASRLPFTGEALPLVPSLEASGGMLAVGAYLVHLASRAAPVVPPDEYSPR